MRHRCNKPTTASMQRLRDIIFQCAGRFKSFVAEATFLADREILLTACTANADTNGHEAIAVLAG